MKREPTAIDLDELLSQIPPEVVTELLATMPAGYLDQAQASSRDTLAAVERGMGAKADMVPRTSVPDWIRLPLLDLSLRWVAGKAGTCRHFPSHRSAAPVFAAAAYPNTVVCALCLPLIDTRGRKTDRVCDCCGHECKGVDAGDPIYPGMNCIGGLYYFWGACSDCVTDSEATA